MAGRLPSMARYDLACSAFIAEDEKEEDDVSR